MLQDENNRLKDRIRAQDAELEAIDAQMLDTQEELETLELTHSSYCDDYEAKETMYKKSIQELNVIASSSNANVSTMLQSKEKAIEQLQNQLGSLESSHEASISYVRQQLEDVSLENETLEAKCLEYKGQSRDVGQGRAHIINELRDQLSSLENLRRIDHDKHARSLKESQQRERQINLVNNDLTRALSQAERRAEDLTNTLQTMERTAVLHNGSGGGGGGGVGGGVGGGGGGHATKEKKEMLKQLSTMEQELDVEKDHTQRVERELRALKHELALSQTTAHTIARRNELVVTEKDDMILTLQTKLKHGGGAGGLGHNGVDSGKQELRKQLNALTEKVLTQQATIEKVTSQRVLLQQSNVELKETNQQLQRVAKRLQRNVGEEEDEEEEDYDLERGGRNNLGSGTAVVQRRRGGRNNAYGEEDRTVPDTPGRRRVSGMTSIKQLRPLLKKNQTIANVLRGIDRFSFLAMNVIRRFPMARLFFLLYMLMLHVWSMFLVFHHGNHCNHQLSGVNQGGASHGHQIPGAMPAIPGPPIH